MPSMTAAALLISSHPLHAVLVAWCGRNPVTKRQARKWLAKYGRHYAAPK
ncbi:MAG: hypothetical protein KAI66_26565 [Lentisphaeria bacterium]|nr:hypothetical protein [Lentisphaeria bacterium]